MSSPSVAHLHVHSEYSLLDGACKIDALAERAAAYDQPAIGLTDHGVMNGSVELYKAAKKHGIKPLLGLEAYYVDDRRVRDRKVERNHLTLLARNDEGFRNLTTLSSKGFLEGLHRGKPGVDMELLAQHAEGVICLTGCLASRSSQRIVADNLGEARAHLDELVQVFGPEDVYFEVQKNGLDEQEQVNAAMKRFAAEMGRPLVATADVHYLRREDFHHHAALLCVQTKSTLAAPKMSFSTNEFYLKSSEEMAESFRDFPGALEATLEIAERCDVSIALDGQLIPRYDCPGGVDEKTYLRELVLEGLRERYGDPPPAAAVERMEMELGVIDRMGFNAYFLIVWDFVNYAKSNGIAVGPGRGSAAGSIVAYCLQITDVDPLRYDLLFERFLNPERVSMPDIDIDFSVRGRERVIRYVTEKYGADRVAQIITFGKMFPRAATRDAARVLGHDYGVGDRLAKLIPDPIMGRPPSFDECLQPGADLANEVARDPVAKQIVDVAQGLEGIVRNASIHAAAVVISDRPLTDIVPLQLADAGTGEDGGKVYRTVTQFSMKPVEELGLLKMDFLGLRNLDVIEDALDIIERSAGERPDMATLPLDDAKTYEMMARGDSIGVFQFESEGMREALKKVGPTEFEDLVALVALYRPGAMDQIPAYARGKRNPDTITFIDDRLRPITESTKGVILYQEQAMQIAKSLAGFSGAKADDLRKAIGKKNRAAMAELQPLFVEGCRASGTAPDVIETLWATNEKSADYSFNKSHAACYALISYRTAWLKANYPAEYMAALISSVMDTKDKVPFFVNQTEAMGIEILPPDVNESDHEFMVVEGNIRFGLDAVKGVGYAAVEAIKKAREDKGPFTSLWDFCERVDARTVNKRSIEALINCGAFGSTGATRRGMIEVLDDAQASGQRAQQDAQTGQGSIFDLIDAKPATDASTPFAAPSHRPIPTHEYDRTELLAKEKESIGIFISEHPLKRVREALKMKADCSCDKVIDQRDGDWVKVGGMITESKKIRTRSGSQMMFATLDDLDGSVEIVVFEKSLAAAEGVVANDAIVLVRGRVDHKEAGKVCVIVQDVEAFEPTDAEIAKAKAQIAKIAATQPTAFKRRVDAAQLPASVVADLRELFERYPGDMEFVLEMHTRTGLRRLKFGADYKVKARDAGFKAELEALLGPATAVAA
ncbi:DNA polymerase III subunit alpha [Candidatus Solirubrobacter pratensis]|uniref:DNA polymerase III subunit alpha n=1 Tax=Candidatus Solirubrobacter pratensis TaxID=1298857 RepID=UPI0003FE6B47|nr:DNA polymerase III subunit alpha [Candidatus Solirubrobacter pratensis]